jgi:hypothetical protein
VGTIGWLITPDVVVVVDSQVPDTARQVLAGVADAGRRFSLTGARKGSITGSGDTSFKEVHP